MQGHIAQVIALAAHGIPALRAINSAARGLAPDNSTLQFCEYVKFFDRLRRGGDEQLVPYADDPQSWLARLEQDGVETLRIHHQSISRPGLSPRMSVAFANGGGRWMIEAPERSGRSFWEPRWEVGDQNHAQKRIWRVNYVRIASGWNSALPGVRRVPELVDALQSNLREIASFARGHELAEFAEAFERARIALRSDDPFRDAYHKDLVPSGLLEIDATRLLGAAQVAWVFGGMGSWNDLGFEAKDQKEYVRLSDELFDLLNESCVAAIHSVAGDG